ncbi:MAG: hypothetical protein KUG77_26185 [Nannocystaceae bacterium]|nr:hypothetical protein [Nannocystaceae bacterium]
MNPTFIFGALLAASGLLTGFEDLPATQPIIDHASLQSALVRDAMRTAETRYKVTCRSTALGHPQTFLLWTLQWASAECPFLDDPSSGVRVTLRFAKMLDGSVSLRRTRVRPVVFELRG